MLGNIYVKSAYTFKYVHVLKVIHSLRSAQKLCAHTFRSTQKVWAHSFSNSTEKVHAYVTVGWHIFKNVHILLKRHKSLIRKNELLEVYIKNILQD